MNWVCYFPYSSVFYVLQSSNMQSKHSTGLRTNDTTKYYRGYIYMTAIMIHIDLAVMASSLEST